MNVQFQRATIYGFGRWVDKTFAFQTDSIHCFYGENEVGKSTLQQFILFILFGLPPRKRTKFYPKRSNQFGGSLTIYHDRVGVVTIERTDKECRCLLADGSERNEAWLQQTVLDGMTESLYRSIYAFSARDLLFIRQMKRRDLSDVLFSIGLTGATAIYDVEKELKRRMDQLFKRTGKRPVLNEALAKTDDLFQKVNSLQQTEATYSSNVREKITLEKKLQQLEKEVTTLREKIAFVKQQYDLYPVLSEYKTVCEKLKRYEKSTPFPERGVTRLEEIKEQLIPLESEHHFITKRIEQINEECEQLKDELVHHTVYEKMQSVLQKRETYERYVMQIDEESRQIDEIKKRIAHVSREVGVDVTAIACSELPYQLEQQLAQLKRTGEHLQEKSDELQQSFHVQTEKEKRLRTEKEKLETNLLKESDRFRFQDVVWTFENRVTRQQTSAWEAHQQKRMKRSISVLVLFSVLSLLFPLIFHENTLYVIPIGLFLFILWQYRALLQVNEVVKREQKAITENEYDEAKRQLETNDEQMTKLRIIDAELQQVTLEREHWEEEKLLFAQKESEWIQQVNRLLEAYPFLEAIEPIFWYDIVEKLRELQQLDEMSKRKNSELERKRTYVKETENELRQLSNLFPNVDVMTMADVRDKMDRYESNEKKFVQLNEQLETMIRERDLLAEKMTRYKAEKTKLLSSAFVNDEESFYEKAKRVIEKEELTEQKEKLRSQLRATFSEIAIRNMMTEEINRSELKMAFDALELEIAEKEAELTKMNRHIAALEVEITQLETSDERSEASFQFYVQRDETYELAKRYTIYKIAFQALQRAKESYQAKFLQAVMQKTTDYFSYLTDGKYVRVYPPKEDELFQVEAKNNIRYTVEELSEGTVDQLYIALRLAIGNVMYKRCPFPFMIDDAFLHFDDDRTENFIQLLRSFEEERQLFVFTCKRSIATYFTPSAVQVE